MNKIIRRDTFEDAKRHIQQFSENIPDNLNLDKVKTSGGLFGWFDHNVTGNELNGLTEKIQGYLIGFSELDKRYIYEFGQVYRALDSLDREYISAILLQIEELDALAQKVKTNQDDISKTIEEQKKIIKVLENHKEKLDKFKHLDNIDEIWKGTIIALKELGEIKQAIDEFKNKIEGYEHLSDIDTIWADLEEHKSTFEEFHELQEKNKEAIHDNAEKIERESEAIRALQEQMTQNQEQYSASYKLLRKRLLISYIAAGASAMLTIIVLVLLVIGVI